MVALDVSNVSQGILDAGSIDGKLYAVCAGMNAPSLFYNKTLLDSLGITVKDNMTIDEFEAVAREVYEKSGVKTDLPYSAGDNYLPYAMRSHDVVKLFNEDSLNVTDAASLVLKIPIVLLFFFILSFFSVIISPRNFKSSALLGRLFSP